jgi:hypothetical protein
MNITGYIKGCERAQREFEAEELQRQRRQRLRAVKPQGRRYAFVRKVLASGCVLYEISSRYAEAEQA